MAACALCVQRRTPVCGLLPADGDRIVSVSGWEHLSRQAGRALGASADASFSKIIVKALLVDTQQGSGGATKLAATADSAVQVVHDAEKHFSNTRAWYRFFELKIMPRSSMVSGDFNEVVESTSRTSAQFVTHLQGHVTKLDELSWSKNNTAMRCGVLTDENGRSLHVTYMSQIAEEFQAEAGLSKK